jgi:hypothetical protein
MLVLVLHTVMTDATTGTYNHLCSAMSCASIMHCANVTQQCKLVVYQYATVPNQKA